MSVPAIILSSQSLPPLFSDPIRFEQTGQTLLHWFQLFVGPNQGAFQQYQVSPDSGYNRVLFQSFPNRKELPGIALRQAVNHQFLSRHR